MTMSTTSGRGREGGTESVAAARVAVGIIPATTCRALEDAVGAVEVALQRAAEVLVLVLVLVDGKMGEVAVGSTDGRRMVGGVGVDVGLVQGLGRPYDEMHLHIGDDTFFFFLFSCSDTFCLLSRLRGLLHLSYLQ